MGKRTFAIFFYMAAVAGLHGISAFHSCSRLFSHIPQIAEMLHLFCFSQKRTFGKNLLFSSHTNATFDCILTNSYLIIPIRKIPVLTSSRSTFRYYSYGSRLHHARQYHFINPDIFYFQFRNQTA